MTTMVSLGVLHESATNPRTTWGDMSGLEDSIRAQGFREEHPLLVRPRPDGGYEIVTGHRRARAARAVGLDEVPCVIDDSLSDQAALEIQLVENAQRSDVHPLDEGEAYRRLRDEYGQSLAQIARKVGKSETSVARRLSLTKLIADGRTALVDEKISLDVAFELSRLPRESMQVEALAIILRPRQPYETELSAKRIIEDIRKKYFLRLAGAQWDLGDVELVPEAGACTTCSKRSGSQPALFADLNAEDTCTDASCFEKKTDAARAVRIDAWKRDGAKFIAQDKARELFNGYAPFPLRWNGDYVDLDDACEDDPERRQWHALIGVDVEPKRVVIAVDPGGRARELVTKDGAAKALLVAGYDWAKKAEKELEASAATKRKNESKSSAASTAKADAAASKWEQERKEEERVENVLLERVAEKVSKLSDEQLMRFAILSNQQLLGPALRRRGLNHDGSGKAVSSLVAGAKGPGLRALFAESIACVELDMGGVDTLDERGAAAQMLAKLGIDPKKIDAEVRAAIADEKKGKGPGAKIEPKKSAKPAAKKAATKTPAKKATKR